MKNLLRIEQRRLLQLQITQYRSPGIKLLLIVLPCILLLRKHKLPAKLPGLKLLKRTLLAPASLLRLLLLLFQSLTRPDMPLQLLLISLPADPKHPRLVHSKNIADQRFLITAVIILLRPVVGRCRAP